MQNKKNNICQKILCAVNIEKNGQKFLWLWRLCLLNRETKCENLSVCFQTKQRWRGHSLYDVLVKVGQCDDKTADDSHFTVRDTHTHTRSCSHAQTNRHRDRRQITTSRFSHPTNQVCLRKHQHTAQSVQNVSHERSQLWNKQSEATCSAWTGIKCNTNSGYFVVFIVQYQTHYFPLIGTGIKS